MSCPMGYGNSGGGGGGGGGGGAASAAGAEPVDMTNEAEADSVGDRTGGTVYYGSYLQLDKVLGAQQPLSKIGDDKKPAHEEMLFIIIHQTYELWFKQIMHEVDSVIKLLSQTPVPESDMALIVNRLERVTEIQKILVAQVTVLETMTPMDFLAFRDFLVPASGFQSRQFRVLETRLGLRTDLRLTYQQTVYTKFFDRSDRAALERSEHQPSLFDVVERWLERTPFLTYADFSFWASYRRAVDAELGAQRRNIEKNPFFEKADRASNLASVDSAAQQFETLFDEQRYADAVQNQPARHFSYKAMQAALLISLYAEEPMFHLPSKLLRLLTDIDEHLTTWRYRHAIMVQRMIGVKVGTGGSSGFAYLRTTTTDRYKVFVDLCMLTTWLLPREALPRLPDGLRRQLGFVAGAATSDDAAAKYGDADEAAAAASSSQ